MIVDVHCHMFNADDLPVGGFVSHHEKVDWVRGKAALARLVDRYLQNRSPDIAADRARLVALLSGLEAGGEPPMAALMESEGEIAAELARDPALAADVQQELSISDAEAGTGTEGFSPADIRRAIRWAALFGQSRLDLPGQYAASSGGGVDLAIPMLVDLDAGVEDQAVSTLAEQVELFDLLSQASMRSLLPAANDLVLHPFVAYDPLRELSHHAGSGESPLDLVKRAVLDHGFVGVKVYPPMGWRPSGNLGNEGERLDEIVLELARWCAQENVPITTHCNDTNYASPGASGSGRPSQWEAMLTECRGLRLNLGHFGGAHGSPDEYEWTREIAGLMADHDGLYADVGCHPVADQEDLEVHIEVVSELAASVPRILRRVMFGTDWYMQAINRDHDEFLGTYRDAWVKAFGAEEESHFMCGNALAFLGFSRPSDKNAARLADRYERLELERPGWLTP